eukprot:c40841_g1_i1 orf=153-332(+)
MKSSLLENSTSCECYFCLLQGNCCTFSFPFYNMVSNPVILLSKYIACNCVLRKTDILNK